MSPELQRQSPGVRNTSSGRWEWLCHDVMSVRRCYDSATSGAVPTADRVLIECHSPHEKRYFDVLVLSRTDEKGTIVGVTVMLTQVTEPHADAIDVDHSLGGRQRVIASVRDIGGLVRSERQTRLIDRCIDGVSDAIFVLDEVQPVVRARQSRRCRDVRIRADRARWLDDPELPRP